MRGEMGKDYVILSLNQSVKQHCTVFRTSVICDIHVFNESFQIFQLMLTTGIAVTRLAVTTNLTDG